MGIQLSDLPPELRRIVLEQAGVKASLPQRRKPLPPQPKSRLMKVCSCLCEIFRPDGIYPDRCDGCGGRWPDPSAPE